MIGFEIELNQCFEFEFKFEFDYIENLRIDGHGERQDDDWLHNYTVANALSIHGRIAPLAILNNLSILPQEQVL